MARSTLSAACLAFMLAVAWTGTALAQETPLAQFSKEVDVLVRLRQPDQTLEKVAKLAESIQPGSGDAIRGQKMALGQAISNPTLTGVDLSRDWYLGIYAHGSEQPPVIVFAIPAIDADDMVSALGPDMTTRVADRWVIYTESESLPEAAVRETVEGEFSEVAKTAFNKGDAGVFINADHLANAYSDELDLARNKVLDSLNNLRFMPQQQDLNLQAMVNIYGRMAEGFFQGIDDAREVSISLSINENEIAVNEHVLFEEGSAASKLLASNPPAELQLIERLPSGAGLYYGVHGAVREMTKFGLEMTKAMLQSKEDEAEFDKVLTKLDSVKFGSIVSSVQLKDSDSGIMQVMGITQAQPIDTVREFTRDVITKMTNMEFSGYSQTGEVKADAETYGDHKADVLTVRQEFDADTPAGPFQQRFQDALFGADGMVSRVLYLKDAYLTSMGGGKQAMDDLLKAYESSSSNGLSKYREQLMPKANLIMFVNLPGMIANGLKAASGLEGFPLPIDEQMVNNLNLQSSFVSFAVGNTPNTLECQTRVPVQQIVDMMKIGMFVGGMMAPQL